MAQRRLHVWVGGGGGAGGGFGRWGRGKTTKKGRRRNPPSPHLHSRSLSTYSLSLSLSLIPPTLHFSNIARVPDYPGARWSRSCWSVLGLGFKLNSRRFRQTLLQLGAARCCTAHCIYSRCLDLNQDLEVWNTALFNGQESRSKGTHDIVFCTQVSKSQTPDQHYALSGIMLIRFLELTPFNTFSFRQQPMDHWFEDA